MFGWAACGAWLAGHRWAVVVYFVAKSIPIFTNYAQLRQPPAVHGAARRLTVRGGRPVGNLQTVGVDSRAELFGWTVGGTLLYWFIDIMVILYNATPAPRGSGALLSNVKEQYATHPR